MAIAAAPVTAPRPRRRLSLLAPVAHPSPTRESHGHQWNRSETLGIAACSCAFCHGLGLVGKDSARPCGCTLRKIFRACLAEWRKNSQIITVWRARPERATGGTGRRGPKVWGFPRQEFVADFENLARKILRADELAIFRMHHLHDMEWRECCQKLKIDKGTFFHTVYRIEERIGRAARELRPYALYPIDEYYRT